MTAGKLYKKLCAAFLLLCLLLTTFAQLTHTHAAAPPVITKAIKADDGITHYAISMADAKCFLCEYQVACDADFLFPALQSAKIFYADVKQLLCTEQVLSFINIAVDGRGPPSFTAAA
jgi:hypothetical protein